MQYDKSIPANLDCQLECLQHSGMPSTTSGQQLPAIQSARPPPRYYWQKTIWTLASSSFAGTRPGCLERLDRYPD